jgi:nucleoside-diphosphate-sugar epimerase
VAKIIVTGASGFIGSHLVPRIQQDGHQVVAVDHSAGDVADAATWKGLPPSDVLVHLAGRSFVPDSWRMPEVYVRSNLLGTIGALEFCRAHTAQLVFISSYMYAETRGVPIKETEPLHVHNPYALSKKLAEEACAFYAQNFDVNVTVLRPFNVYGPGQAGQFLIPFIMRQVAEKMTIEVKDLAPKRDYVYVDDLVDAIVRACVSASGLHVYNIGSGRSHSVGEVVEFIQYAAKTTLPVTSKEERRIGELMDTVADISAAAESLGWSPRYSLREGIENTWRLRKVRPGATYVKT